MRRVVMVDLGNANTHFAGFGIHMSIGRMAIRVLTEKNSRAKWAI
jgi:hypothetical protein